MSAPATTPVGPGTLITVKVTYDDHTRRFKIPLRDLGARTLPQNVGSVPTLAPTAAIGGLHRTFGPFTLPVVLLSYASFLSCVFPSLLYAKRQTIQPSYHLILTILTVVAPVAWHPGGYQRDLRAVFR